MGVNQEIEVRVARQSRLMCPITNYCDPFYLHHRKLFTALLEVAPNVCGRLLDIGCGNKPYYSYFRPHVREYIGCDIVQSSLNKVDILAPATNIPLSDGSFDSVVSTQAIEHIGDTAAFLREVHRLLGEHGIFILSGPMYWPLHEEPHDYYRFTKYGFRCLLTRHGFDVEKVIANGGKWSVLGLVLLHTYPNYRIGYKSLVWLVNRLFSFLDDRFPDEVNTSNYVIMARKKRTS